MSLPTAYIVGQIFGCTVAVTYIIICIIQFRRERFCKNVGAMTYALHRSVLIAVVLIAFRSIDPHAVLGIYPVALYWFLRHNITSALLCCFICWLHVLLQSFYHIIRAPYPNWIRNVHYAVAALLVVVKNLFFILFIVYDEQWPSAGSLFVNALSIIILFIGLQCSTSRLAKEIRKTVNVIARKNSRSRRRSVTAQISLNEPLRKLIIVRWAVSVSFIVTIAIQFIAVGQLSRSKFESPSRTTYTVRIVINWYAQLLICAIPMWYSWIRKSSTEYLGIHPISNTESTLSK